MDHSAYGPVTEEPLSRIAQIASANLSAANTMIPQVTHHDRADMRAVEAFRKTLKDEGAARGTKITALAFHVMALARCLAGLPALQRLADARWRNAGAEGLRPYRHRRRHAARADGSRHPRRGPKGLWQIAADITDLAGRAQARKLSGDEMGGASMSISNLGGIGGTAFTPIVNPPEVAILGLTRAETVPVWENGDWQPVPMVPLDLSYDHRVINGADAARFLAHYARLLADPRRMVLA